MQCEDFLVALFCLIATIERLKEIRAAQHGVVGPLLFGLEEERVKKSLIFMLMIQWSGFDETEATWEPLDQLNERGCSREGVRLC